MKVLLVHNSYRQRGGEDSVFEAERELLRQSGHELVEYHVHNDEVDEGSKLKLFARTVWSRESAAALRDLVRRECPQVAHFHNTLPLISQAAYRAVRDEGVAVVQTLHNYRMGCPSAILFRDGRVCEDCIGRRFAWPAIQHACYRGSRPATAAVAFSTAFHRARGTYRNDVDAFIALTDFAKAKVEQAGLPRDSMTVLANFLADDPGVGDPETRSGLLFVGRLTEEKGIPTLLEAIRDPAFPGDLPVRIVGDGPLAERVREAAEREPQLEWSGSCGRDEVLEAMRSSAMLIVPSTWYEGFPMTIVEAYACGLPVVASDLGSLGSVVDEEVGRTFEPGNPEALARAVGTLHEDRPGLRARGEVARSRYESRFSSGAHLRGLERIYEAAVHRRRRGGPLVVPGEHSGENTEAQRQHVTARAVTLRT